MKNPLDLQIRRESSTLRQQVADKLRSAILEGSLEPGTKLIERDLCEMLGVSRTVLREALQSLGAEGLITNVPHKGPTVATITRKEAQDIYNVRAALEALAGKDFALNATEEQIRSLRAALDRLESASQRGSTHELLEIKNQFYATLLEGCGNAVVAQMLTLLNNRITLLRRMSLSRPGRSKETLAELKEIVNAIEQRNGDRAYELCAAHVAKAAQVALSSMGDEA
ncbi:MAG TPA: GntR family transcriptional regulator [Burkholderiaceae bacterium]|nr:GntR family transcriptional regulator [Burkholderiaceae bacterium]